MTPKLTNTQTPCRQGYFSGNAPLFFLLCLFASVGAIILWIATEPWGIGATDDSAVYLSGARSILKGIGFRSYILNRPITQWPPLFPFSLAGLGILGVDPLEGSRLLNVFLFGVNAMIAGLILKKVTASSKTALLGAWLMLTSNAMFEIHSMAWSERLFLSLVFPAFFFLHQYLENGKKIFLILASLLIAAACLDRYAGVSSIVTGVLVLLLLHRRSFVTRIRDSFIFLAVTLLPLGLWLLRNDRIAHNLVQRDMQFHLPNARYFQLAGETLSTWLLPAELPAPLRHAVFSLAFTLFLATLIIVFSKQIKNGSSKVLSERPSLTFIACMLLFALNDAVLHFVHLLLVNVNSNLNDRYFSSVYVACLISALIVLSEFRRLYQNSNILKGILIICVVLVTSSYLFSTERNFVEMYRNGRAWTSRSWRTSPTIAKVKALPRDSLIYTNNAAVIYLNTEKPAWPLPRKYDYAHSLTPGTAKLDKRYLWNLGRLTEQFKSRRGYLVFFENRNWWFNIPQQELENSLSLQVIEELSDGVIYQGKAKSTASI